MADTTIKKWNSTGGANNDGAWEELYPETTVSQLVATGDRDSTTFLRGDGVFSDTLTGTLTMGSTNVTPAPINIKSNSSNKAIYIEEQGAGTEYFSMGVDTAGNLNFYNSGSTTPYVRFMDDNNVTISNILTVGGITGSNYNITGVNQLEINDPGEGIVFKQGSSGDMTLAVVDDNDDNILRFSGTGAKLQVGTETVLTEETGAKRIDLTSQVQLSSYRKSVIALCNIDNSSISRNSWSGGTIFFHRTNGLHAPVTLHITMEKRYNAQGANYTAMVLSGDSFGDNIQYVQFDYNGTPYGGIEFKFSDAEHAQVYFIGETNFDIFGLDYLSTGPSTTTVLNSEVNNSISTTDMVAETDFFINNQNIWHSGNDGTSSGLSADYLDGYHGTSYLRNNIDQTHAANLRIESGSFASLILDRGTTGSGSVVQFENNNGVIGGIGAYGDDGLQFRTTDGTQMVLDASNNLGLGTETPTQKLDVTGNIRASSNMYAARYYDLNNTSYYVDPASTSVFNALTVGGDNVETEEFASTYTTIASNGWNDYALGRGIFSRSDSSGLPSGGTHGYWLTLGRRDVSGGYAGIYVNNYSTSGSGVYIGRNDNGGNPTWEKVWTDKTDGSGSTLDADLLDGNHASAFATAGHTHTNLVSVSGDSMTGDLQLDKDGTTDVGSHGIVFQAHSSLVGSGELGTYTTELNMDSTGNLKFGSSTIFHSGNDGSASGIDADLLDGQQGSYYLDYNNFTNTPSGGGEYEWEYVDVVDGGTSSTLTYSSMSPASYEYKFVIECQTTAEDTSNPYIRINNDSSNEYSYQYESVTQTAETTESAVNVGDALTNLIYTGADLSSYSNGGSSPSTVHRAEFVYAVSPYSTYPGMYTATIRGFAHTHYVSQTGTSYDGMVQSTFVGTKDNIYLTEQNRIDYIHNITAGSTDNLEMRVYRRARK